MIFGLKKIFLTSNFYHASMAGSRYRGIETVEIYNMDILEYDKNHLWHPYTSMREPLPVYQVVGCDGVYIELADGRRLIDGMSSWWSAVHGYNNGRLNAAAVAQLAKFSHVMFGGLTHEPAVRLAAKIVEMTPAGLEHVFFADSGSVAMEVALKMALQWQHSQSASTRNILLTVRGGYHGDTWHAMSVCDPVTGMHSLFEGRLTKQIFVDRPRVRFGEQWDPSDLDQLRATLAAAASGDGGVAAIVLEPVVQGAGGMYFYHPEYLRGVRRLCDEYGILMIADEIATGFGRTGKMFACQWADIVPDIMCVGKALTGGYMTLSAVIATSRVAMGIEGSFMHGPTFMANPLACAVALESLTLLTEDLYFSTLDHNTDGGGGVSLLERISQIEGIMKRELSELSQVDVVADVRVLGAIGVVELKRDVDMATIQADFVDHGVWVRPFGKLVYIMPQYIISDAQLVELCGAMSAVVRNI